VRSIIATSVCIGVHHCNVGYSSEMSPNCLTHALISSQRHGGGADVGIQACLLFSEMNFQLLTFTVRFAQYSTTLS